MTEEYYQTIYIELLSQSTEDDNNSDNDNDNGSPHIILH